MSKKNLFLLVIASIFIACSQSHWTNDVEDVNGPLNSKTLTELSTFNENLLINKTVDPATLKSNWWRKFKDGLIVSAADIAGVGAGIYSVQGVAALAGVASGGTGYVVVSAVGGVIVGAGASMAAYDALPECAYAGTEEKVAFAALSEEDLIELYSSNQSNIQGEAPPADNYEYNYILERINLPAEFEHLRRVGEDHNKIVKLAYNKGGITTKSLLKGGGEETSKPKDEDKDCVLPEIPSAVCEIVSELVYDKEFKGIRQDILTCIESACTSDIFDPEIFFNEYPMKSKCVEDAIKLYLSLYVNFPDNLDDIVDIANGYINIIEQNNEFTYNEKESIYSALIISLYSPQIWN